MLSKLKKNKEFLMYIPIVLLFPVALNFILFSFDLGISYGDGNVWLAFWGNYTGGLISALVAYFVANSQIQKQVSLDLDQRYFELATNQLPALIRLRIELEKVIPELENTKKEIEHLLNILRRQKMESGEELESQDSSQFSSVFPDSVLKQIFYHSDSMDKEVLRYLEKVEDIDLQIELIDAFSFYDKFSKAMNFDFHLTNKRKDELLFQNSSYDYSDSAIESEIFNISIEQEKALKERRTGFSALYDENKIEKIKETLTRLTEEIDRSYRIKKDGTMGV